jgi:tetratricopeptide (TPR) repeat protein
MSQAMKPYCTILLLVFLAGGAWSQTAPGGRMLRPAGSLSIADDRSITDSLQIDSLEKRAFLGLDQKTGKAIDSVPYETTKAMAASERLGYIHGKAVALACQAIFMNMHKGDFIRAEQLARQSLDAFGHAGNQQEIIRAHYALGFSLFAQSRYDEALYYYARAGEDASRSGNCTEEIYMLSLEGKAYQERGDYEKAFDIQRQCIQVAEFLHHPELVKSEYLTLAQLFVQIEDYGSAEKYFRIGFGTGRPEQAHPWDMMVYAELLTHQRKYDSALYYYGRFDSAHAGQGMLKAYLLSKGEYYVIRGDYATALPYFAGSLIYQRRLNDRNQLMRCLGDLSRAYAGLRQNAAAFRYAREDLSLAGAVHARQNIRDACQLLSTLYDREGRTDSAYFYFRRYILLKDSVLNDQLKGKFASYGFEQQIRLLNQEKQLEDVCLREEMLTKKLLITGIAVLLLLSVIYFWIVRLKRRNEEYRRKRAENELEIQRLEGERAKAALMQRAKELEVQALRSQMNPHFVFNCLNAINRFILSHEAEAASDYLTKFSRLMRMIMNHSRHSTVTLAEETEMLRLYLDMERLRFKDAFDYSIVTGPEVDAGELLIPPLLLQPFIENAVWHGLMHKEERGWLSITMDVRDQVLTCIIRDNGIGRRKAALLKSKSAQKHKSMGLQITAERMALLTGTDAKEPFFTIEDLYDEDGNAAGTQVTLTIRVYDHTGEPVGITS